VQKGDIVVTSPAVAMRLPEVFKDPDVFDPDRFAEPREEHKTPFSYLGFGGGMHACMGQQFGYMQVKTILSVLLRKYELEMVDGIPEPDYTAMVVGPKGHPTCRYKKRRVA
jgi:sterol 14-demethylase